VEGRRLWEAVLHPQQLSDDQIQEITKLTRAQFFQLCSETKPASEYSGRGPRLQLCHESRVLVFFLRAVKNVSFRYIEGRFLHSRKVITRSYLDVLFFIFLRHPCIPCLWNDSGMSSDRMNVILENFISAVTPGKRDYVSKFRDARGRRVCFVTDDGTEIHVPRSADAGLAQVTDSGGRGGMNKGVCYLLAITVAVDGTIVGVRPAPAISGGRRAGIYLLSTMQTQMARIDGDPKALYSPPRRRHHHGGPARRGGAGGRVGRLPHLPARHGRHRGGAGGGLGLRLPRQCGHVRQPEAAGGVGEAARRPAAPLQEPVLDVGR
jgi:hypothetical protein